MQRFRTVADTPRMLTRSLPRFAQLGVVSLASACFSPIVPPLEDGSGTSGTTEQLSSDSSPSTDQGPLDEGSSTGEAATCGNGMVDPGEICDDGVNDGTYGGCVEGCSALAGRCGDGILHGAEGEACDDGDEIEGNGCNTDCLVSGTLLWSDIVDGTSSGLPDRGGAVALAADGTIFVTGTADETGPSLGKVWLRRYSSDGSVEWTELRIADGDLSADDLSLLDSGDLVVGALYDEPLGDRIPRLLAYTPEGEPRWGFTHTQPYANVSLAAVPSGFVALTTDVSQSAWLRRFDVEGMPVWTEMPPLMPNESDIASFPDGGFVIAGTLGSDVWVRRFTAEANELWTQMLDGRGAVGGLAVTATQQIVVAGYDPDYWVESLDSDGGPQWSDDRAEPDGWFFAADVAASPEGDVFVVGTRKQAVDPDFGRLYVARYSSTGMLMWEQAFASPFLADGSASASGAAVDGAGNVVIVGTVSSDAGNDFWILKLAA